MAQISVSTRRFIGWLRHWIYSSHRQVALILAVEATGAVFGLPLWAHVALAAALHWIMARRRR